MNYTEINDDELYSMICENDEDAKDILFRKYKSRIGTEIKKYSFVAMRLNIDYKDLYQEALVGFSDALKSYDQEKAASLATFIKICVNRRLQNFIKKSGCIKNKIFMDSLSLEHVYDQYDLPLKDVISDDNSQDPLFNITKDENYEELVAKINSKLSPSELEVYKLLVGGMNYLEIAKLLGKNPKQVDNAIQRIKNKVKLILKTIDF